ncbi:hypothetical protein C6499_18235, partial [Candidatus Poribacteria bacterium]
FTLILIAGITGCTRDNETSEAGENPIAAGGSDEESANQLTLAETYDHTRKGARLILAYDEATNTFKGTVENTTNAILQQVRVEIHLFNSQGPDPTDPELGPTPPRDLAPSEKIPIELMAIDEPFDMWVAHPEVGPSSTGGGEGGGEHAGEGGEHGAGGEGGGGG